MLAGCNPKPTMAVGGVTTVAGLLITQVPDNCGDKLICFENSEVGTAIAMVGLVIAGIGAIAYGLETPPPAPLAAGSAPPAPFPVPMMGPPGFDDPPVAPPPALPRTRLPAAELDYPSPAERQMALQASAAAQRHDCRAALASAQELSVDTRHRLAFVDPDFARCDR